MGTGNLGIGGTGKVGKGVREKWASFLIFKY